MDRFPRYQGLDWERKISNLDDPNFWKYGVANLIFLDHVRDRKLVLDLGCGTGGSTCFLAEKANAEWIIGVDLVTDMIKVAKKKGLDKGRVQKICFLVCDGRYLPFKASCFDALVSRGDAFCFLVPLKIAVQELKRVMKPEGVIVLEMDNRVDWKPGTIISTGFKKTPNGAIAYLVEAFTSKRNHRTVSYVLDPKGRIAKRIAGDIEFQEKGSKACEYSPQEVKEETIGIRVGTLTHWPTAKELYTLFNKGGFKEVQVIGDGLLMNLLLSGDRTIIEAMRKDPRLFFEIEKVMVPYVNPDKAPTIILLATVP